MNIQKLSSSLQTYTKISKKRTFDIKSCLTSNNLDVLSNQTHIVAIETLNGFVLAQWNLEDNIFEPNCIYQQCWII